MADDMFPVLLDTVRQAFLDACAKDKELQRLLSLVESGSADYAVAQEYAIRLGELLSAALSANIAGDSLPDGKMYYNIARRLFDAVLPDQFRQITDVCTLVQDSLNAAAGLGIVAATATLNQDRIDGIVKKISDTDLFDDVKWMLESPIVNFSQSVVDDNIVANAELQKNLGLQPKISRTAEAGACKWCRSLAGVYDYPDVPADFYRRHENCRCTITYDPKDGRGTQNAHTRAWTRVR